MSHASCHHHIALRPGRDALSSRRRFLKLTSLAAGVALFGLAPRAARAAETEALLLSCMDFRLMDDIVRYMDKRGLNNNYDHVILAGASLGVLAEKYPAWGRTFWDHVAVASDLHNIKKLIVMDHRDCGAYKLMLGPEHAKDKATETAAHAGQMRKLREAVLKAHPKLQVELLLMALDGSVETIT